VSETAVREEQPQQLRLASQKRDGYWGGRTGFPKGLTMYSTEPNNATLDHWLGNHRWNRLKRSPGV